MPGIAALNTGGFAVPKLVSCASAGNCGSGGFYTDASGHHQAFVIGEANGTWGTAEEVPGTAALNQGGGAQITSVSCASAGNCSAGGSYRDSSGHSQAFVAKEKSGTWRTARQVAAGLNKGGLAVTRSVSCASAGNCSGGGQYTDASGHRQAFVVGEANGTWGTAHEAATALNQGGLAGISSVSCASAGNCSAGGSYRDASSNTQAFVVGET